MISIPSAAILNSFILPDNRLPKGARIKCLHLSSHRNVSLDGLELFIESRGFIPKLRGLFIQIPREQFQVWPHRHSLTSACRLSSRMICWLVDEFFSRKSSLRAWTCMESCLSTSDACKRQDVFRMDQRECAKEVCCESQVSLCTCVPQSFRVSVSTFTINDGLGLRLLH